MGFNRFTRFNTFVLVASCVGKSSHVGNSQCHVYHPPVITIVIGDIFTIPRIFSCFSCTCLLTPMVLFGLQAVGVYGPDISQGFPDVSRLPPCQFCQPLTFVLVKSSEHPYGGFHKWRYPKVDGL